MEKSVIARSSYLLCLSTPFNVPLNGINLSRTHNYGRCGAGDTACIMLHNYRQALEYNSLKGPNRSQMECMKVMRSGLLYFVNLDSRQAHGCFM